jgi:hypothetical protein
MVLAGQVAREILPADAKVIAPYMGDTAFLWQTRRRGWPIGFEIEDKISSGATHYVTVNFDSEAQELMERYKILMMTNEYLILDLTQSATVSDGLVSDDSGLVNELGVASEKSMEGEYR